MKPSSLSRISTFLLLAMLGATGASAQQPYQLSSKFHEGSFIRGNAWDGKDG